MNAWSGPEMLIAAAGLLLTATSLFGGLCMATVARRLDDLQRSIKETQVHSDDKARELKADTRLALHEMASKFAEVLGSIGALVEKLHQVELESAKQLEGMRTELRNVVKHERFSALEYRVTDLEHRVNDIEPDGARHHHPVPQSSAGIASNAR